jgi:hypothetical protein
MYRMAKKEISGEIKNIGVSVSPGRDYGAYVVKAVRQHHHSGDMPDVCGNVIVSDCLTECNGMVVKRDCLAAVSCLTF